jgi:hypothetical protein
MLTIDLSLDNPWLYQGCTVEEVAGRLNLLTPPQDALNTIGRNLRAWLQEHAPGHTEVTLTGPMAVWAYLLVFHAVVHRFNKVYYNDGRNPILLIAAHG